VRFHVAISRWVGASGGTTFILAVRVVSGDKTCYDVTTGQESARFSASSPLLPSDYGSPGPQ
jgi:hypothetical protein